MPEGDHFVPVPAADLFAFLESKGFARAPESLRSSKEVVYQRFHAKDPRYVVLVYTSVSAGAGKARALGADAIRVVALFQEEPGVPGSHTEARKFPRVFRTGTVEGVFERMLGRIRAAYAKCNDAIDSRAHPRRRG